MIKMKCESLQIRNFHQVKTEDMVRLVLKRLEAVIAVFAIVFVLIFVLVFFLGTLFVFVFLDVLGEMLGVESWMGLGRVVVSNTPLLAKGV